MRRAIIGAAGVVVVLAAGGCMPPSWAANALLHPQRRPMTRQPNRPADVVEFEGDGVKLKGWWFRGGKRGTIVYLHGVADNRGSAVGIADHFVARGFEVVAFDSRAHGESGGDACTYGFYEKGDLRRVLDRVTTTPIVLMGVSLGASIALQEAADDRRIAAIVAVSPYSDLRTVARERAPFFASEGNIKEAFKLAEAQGNFRVDDVSPVAAAPHITAPTLVIHGERDDETPPAHSQRIYAALRDPKRLIIVAGASHHHVLGAQQWNDIDGWLDAVAAPAKSDVAKCGSAPPAGVAKLASYNDVHVPARYWIDVGWRDQEWQPTEHLPMPRHHATRLELANLAAFPALAGHHDGRVRLTIDITSRDVRKVPDRNEWRATYAATIVDGCVPPAPRP